jgi:F420-0:gamma-glutamyl ligase
VVQASVVANGLFVISILAGFGSALFWGWSALVPIPKEILFEARCGAGMPNAGVDETMVALRWQSTLNKRAAVLAAAAVLAQALEKIVEALV